MNDTVATAGRKRTFAIAGCNLCTTAVDELTTRRRRSQRTPVEGGHRVSHATDSPGRLGKRDTTARTDEEESHRTCLSISGTAHERSETATQRKGQHQVSRVQWLAGAFITTPHWYHRTTIPSTHRTGSVVNGIDAIPRHSSGGEEP